MKFTRLVAIASLSVTLAVGGFPSLAWTETKLTPPQTPVPLTYMGLHIHYSSDRDWPSVPFGSWRLLGDHVMWYDLEPQKGQWTFKELDKDVALAEKNHLQLMLNLSSTPTWASARPQEIRKLQNHPGYTAEPKDINDWRNYVRTVATRYKGKIQAYEVWNEPNGGDFFSGTVDQLVTLTKEAYAILHEVDPNIIVVSSPPSGSGFAYLDKYLAAGGGKYADVIGFHFYVSPRPPEAMVGMAAQVKQIMAKYGLSGKPLWCTETGYFLESHGRQVKPLGTLFPVIPREQAAAYIARSYILVWATGVPRLYWYGWDDPSMGLAEGEGIGTNIGTIPKLAADAYHRVASWLVGGVVRSCTADASETWVCEVTRDDKYLGHIIWNPRGEKKFPIPADWEARRVEHLYGPNTSVEGAKDAPIGPMPVLLENKSSKTPRLP
jgi:hypothetical protein